MCCCYVVFFFKQKTAYEMRISDWSSDVCSSDLIRSQQGAHMATKIEIPARDADRTRQAILDAAQQVFAEKGFAEAGVRDITARAGVNPSLVSRYFGGKLKLFEAALDAALDARLMSSEEHTSELQSLMRNSYAVFGLE